MRRRRRPGRQTTSEPDLAVLLATVGAAQATSPTAQAQAAMGSGVGVGTIEPRVAVFADAAGASACQSHRFAALAAPATTKP